MRKKKDECQTWHESEMHIVQTRTVRLSSAHHRSETSPILRCRDPSILRSRSGFVVRAMLFHARPAGGERDPFNCRASRCSTHRNDLVMQCIRKGAHLARLNVA